MAKTLGIIGCGAVTQSNYAKVLSVYHDIDVKYVFDINDELAQQAAKLFDAEVTTKENLLNNSDIIVIATPPSTHHSLVKEALKKGKKVVCEKPFVGNVKDCNDLLASAATAGAELYVAHFRRLFPSVIMARSIVRSGLLGDITSIEVYEGGRFSWKTQSGYVYKDPYGGVLFDTGSHTIDTALFMADMDEKGMNPEVVSIVKDKEEPAHDVRARLKLKTAANDIDFTIKLSRKILLANKVRITGTNGYMDIPAGMTSYLRLGSKNSSTIIYSNIEYPDLMDCFAVQFKEMFYDVQDSIFNASRFVNLTKVLETIVNN